MQTISLGHVHGQKPKPYLTHVEGALWWCPENLVGEAQIPRLSKKKKDLRAENKFINKHGLLFSFHMDQYFLVLMKIISHVITM